MGWRTPATAATLLCEQRSLRRLEFETETVQITECLGFRCHSDHHSWTRSLQGSRQNNPVIPTALFSYSGQTLKLCP